MAKPKHHKKDRGGDNKEEVKNLRAAILSASKFLNSQKSDRDRGSFNDAATKLKVVGAITDADLKEIGLDTKSAPATFNALGNPKKAKASGVVALTSEQKRALIQRGENTARAKGAEFGLRMAA